MNEKALIVAEKLDADKVFFEGGMGKVLDSIKDRIDEFNGDATTEEGRKEIVSMAYRVSRSKTFLDKIRKELISDAKAKIDKANATWNPAKAQLDAWRDEIRRPVTEYEAEQELIKERRDAEIKEKIDYLKSLTANYVEDPVEEIDRIISLLEEVAIEPDVFYDRTSEAQEIVDERRQWAIDQRARRLEFDRAEAKRKAEQERLDAERAELERNLKEQAEKDRIEREKREEAQAKLDEERRKFEEEKAKHERVEREKREAKEKAEREAKERAEAEKKSQRSCRTGRTAQTGP